MNKKFSSRQILWLSFLIFLLFFSLSRLPFFLYEPTVTIKPDSFHYYTIVDQIDKGFFPVFSIRTPGYPLFLWLIFLFFKSNLAVIVIQNLFSLAATLFFIATIHRISRNTSRFLPLLASIGLGIFVSSSIHLHLDSCLATESLFINFIIMFLSFLIRALDDHRHLNWTLGGLSLAAVIIIRPAGLFFISIFLLILLFSWLNAYPKKAILFFSLAFIIPLLTLATYNHFTIKSFSLTTFSEHALISFTNTFLEARPDYQPGVRQAIRQSQKFITSSNREIMEKTWNQRELKRLLQKGYNRGRTVIFKVLKSREDPQADNLYLNWRPLLKKISLDAVRGNPVIYIKYFYANLADFFNLKKHNYRHHWLNKKGKRKVVNHKKIFSGYLHPPKKDSLRIYYKNSYRRTIDGQFLKNFLKEYFDSPVPDRTAEPANSEKGMVSVGFRRFQRVYDSIHRMLFQNQFWICFFFFSLIFSLVRLVSTRFSHQGSFLVFLMTLAALCHGLVVSITSIADPRLSSPLDFIYYLSFFLFPILWLPESREPACQTGSSRQKGRE